MRLWILALLASCVFGCSRERAVHVPAERAAELLVNRNWVDRWPADKDERLHVYRFVPAMGQSGVYHDRTLFTGTFELFLYAVDRDTLRFHFPDDGKQETVRFTIEEIDGPGPSDLRLTLTPSPRGPRAYYGRKAETATTMEALDAQLAPR
jgi:hypothetical protein